MSRLSINRPIGLVLAPILMLAWSSSPAPVSGQQQCEHEVCGFDELSTRAIGSCLQRPLSEGGQGDEVQAAMQEVYALVKESGVTVGGRNAISDPAVQDSILLDAINAVRAGAAVPNSEGLYYCLRDDATGADAFYWVLNCGVLREDRGGSGDIVLCDGLTPAETTIAGDLDAVAYVVDATLFGDDTWRRYVFNNEVVALTEVQPVEGGGFVCSERPWFQTNVCLDPLATTCPTGFEGTTGRGAFQSYGEEGVAIVAQDVREWHLEPCLEQDSAGDSGVNVVAIAVPVAVVVALLLGIIAFLAYRISKLKSHTKDMETRGEVVPPISTRMLMSSIIRHPSKVVEKARESQTVHVAAVQEDDEESS